MSKGKKYLLVIFIAVILLECSIANAIYACSIAVAADCTAACVSFVNDPNDIEMDLPNGLEGRADFVAYIRELKEARDSAIGLETSLDADYGSYLTDSDRQVLSECGNGIRNAMTFSAIDGYRAQYDDLKNTKQKEKEKELEAKEETLALSTTYSITTKPTPSSWSFIEATDLSPDSGQRDSSLYETSWGLNKEYLDRMASYAAKYDSATDWFIVMDYDLCRMTVLHRDGSNWRAVKAYNAGYSPHRWSGTWTIVHKQICNWADSYFTGDMTWTCNDWSSCFIEAYSDDDNGGRNRYIEGKGYEDCASIHSTSREDTGYYNSGCTSLRPVYSKWVWDNVDCNTTIYFF